MNSKTHWIIRVKDGINFENSKYPFWGLKRCWKFYVQQIKSGDILWFLTNKTSGGQIIGMAEFTEFYDRKDEPLVKINTCNNEEQFWIGGEKWDLQIHFINFYDTKNKEFLKAVIHHRSTIIQYDTVKNNSKDNLPDLEVHYNNLTLYAEKSKRFI